MSGPRARLNLEPLDERLTPSARGFSVFGAAPGGLPLVEVRRPDGSVLTRFQAFNEILTGGVRVAAGELDYNPNTIEVVAGAGPGWEPRVNVFAVDVNSGAFSKVANFMAFEPAFRGGVRVAVGDVMQTGVIDQIVVGADLGGGSRVRTLWLAGDRVVQDQSAIGNFFAFEPEFRGGVRVAAGNLDGDPANGDVLVAAAGVGGGPRVKGFSPDGTTVTDFFALSPNFHGGLAVGFQSSASGRGLFYATPTDEDPAQGSDELNDAAGIGRGFGLPPVAVIPSGLGPVQTVITDPATGLAVGATGLVISTNGVIFGDPDLVEQLGLNATALFPSNTATSAAVAVTSGAAVGNPLSLGTQKLNLILGNGGVAPGQSLIVGSGSLSLGSDGRIVVPSGGATTRGSSLSQTILNQAVNAALSNFDL